MGGVDALDPLPRQDKVRPAGGFLARVRLAHHLAEDIHPCLLLGGAVGVKVDSLAIRKPNSESFFDVLVSFVFFGESGLATTVLAGWIPGLGISDKCALVIN